MAMRRWAILYVVLERKSQAEARSVYGRGQTCLGVWRLQPALFAELVLSNGLKELNQTRGTPMCCRWSRTAPKPVTIDPGDWRDSGLENPR